MFAIYLFFKKNLKMKAAFITCINLDSQEGLWSQPTPGKDWGWTIPWISTAEEDKGIAGKGWITGS